MSMFKSYDNLDTNYIPNNIKQEPACTFIKLDKSLPRKLYNLKKQFIGYGWTAGDILKFNVSVADTIKVKEDSIIYEFSGQYPDTKTVGHKYQQAYNLIDCVSWTCVDVVNGVYVWLRNECLTYSADGTKEITFKPDMLSKTLKVDLYNFRWELVKSYEQNYTNTITIDIDEELTQQLSSGIYHCVVSVETDIETYTRNTFMIYIQ